MPKDSLMNLLKKFPYFFDKSEESNFFKSQSVTNAQFKDLYQGLFDVAESLHLDKKCLIWKTQDGLYDYSINFVANYPNLKSVECYKNDSLIYMEEYSFDDNISSFSYIHTDSTLNDGARPIPDDKFSIKVETYNEYTVEKGFPENDTIENNIYDHDRSLDVFGKLNNIPRKEYIPVSSVDYPYTEPPYNDRLTEDDYHYMRRILKYNLGLWTTPRPILEIEKTLGVTAKMRNREEDLIRMIDMNKHPEAIIYDEAGVAVDFDSTAWTPAPWQHKNSQGLSSDLMCGKEKQNIFFFVDCSNQQPLLNQWVYFYFKFLNEFAENVTGEYYVKPYLNGEDFTLTSEGYWRINSNDLDANDINTFYFEVYGDETATGEILFTSDEILVQIRGCDTGDWYVDSSNGSDSNNGSHDAPFETITKALNSVYGDRNLIILMSEEYTISGNLPVTNDSQILSCVESIINLTNETDCFLLSPGKKLSLKNIGLTYDENTMFHTDNIFVNNNINGKNMHIGVNPRHSSNDKIGTSISIASSSSSIYLSQSVTISGVLKDSDDNVLSGKSVILSYSGSSQTLTTDNNGAYTATVTPASTGTVAFTVQYEGDEDYRSCNNHVDVSVNATYADSVTLTSTKSTSMYVDESCVFTATVKDNLNTVMSGVTVNFYNGSSLIATSTTNSSGVATYTYNGSVVTSLNIKAIAGSVESSSISLSVVKRPITLSLSSSSSTVIVGDTVTVSGTLKTGDTGLSGKSIGITIGGTLVDTVTTSSGGSFSYSNSSLSIGTYSFKAVFDGDSVYSDGESSSVSVTVSDLPVPTISLSATSASISVGDTPGLTGSLVYDGSGITGASVKIYLGNNLLDTVTTGSGGAFSFTGSATSSEGTLTYHAVFEGDSTYGSVTSSNVEITVSRLEPTLSAAASSSTVIYSDGATISGSLLYNNTGITGATINLYDDDSGTIVDTVTTDSSGDYSFSISYQLADIGTHVYYADFEGNSMYDSVASSNVSVTVIDAPTVDSISLTGDKSILSYVDHESCTLTATCLDSNSQPVEGATVSFDIVSGGTVVSHIDSDTTDSSGIATVSYLGNHAGDLYIQASCGILLSEIYSLEDTWKYDPTTHSANKDYNLQLPSKYSLEFDMLKKGTSDGSAGGMVLGTASNYFMVGCGSSTSYQVARWGTNLSYVNLFSLTHNTWKTIKLEVDGSTVDIKADGNTYTVTGISSDITSSLYQINCNNTNINIRNLKIKPL